MQLDQADVEWGEDGCPRSRRYGDLYFSAEDGLAETRHVFLSGNDLPGRWSSRSRFTVAETGFGTGLNFLACWNAWRRAELDDSHLHYVAIEKHPVGPEDIARLGARWPELASLAEALGEVYPIPFSGIHRRLVAADVTLTLCFVDVAGGLEELLGGGEASVDAWFLDGFAPSRNPEMWAPELYGPIARLTGPGGTVATYSVSGAVRRGLQKAGFSVEKRPGFGAKREMLAGRIESRSRPDAGSRQAVVVGGGIAGCSAAHGLLRRGWRVTVVEREDRVASGASGNPAGIVMPYPQARATVADRFFSEAFDHSRSRARSLSSWRESGVLQLAHDDRQARRRLAIAGRDLDPLCGLVAASEASELCGFSTELDALHFPRAGWLHPPELSHRFLEGFGDRLDLVLRREAIRIEPDAGEWRVADETGDDIARGSVVVVATARDARHALPGIRLPLTTVRGQLALVPAGPVSSALSCVVCYDGYALPARDEVHTIGATFDRGDEDPELRGDDHHHILERLRQRFPDFHRALGAAASMPAGRVAFRATTPDQNPLVGPISEVGGLHVSVGHGSRGLVTAPLAGELIASMVEGEAPPMDAEMRSAVDPARFDLIA